MKRLLKNGKPVDAKELLKGEFSSPVYKAGCSTVWGFSARVQEEGSIKINSDTYTYGEPNE